MIKTVSDKLNIINDSHSGRAAFLEDWKVGYVVYDSLVSVRVEDLFYESSLELIEQLVVVFLNELWMFSF